METEHLIELVPIDASNWRLALDVRLGDGQLHFVADHEPVALVILAKAAVGEGGARWEPLGVLSGSAMVGVMALAHHDQEVWLFHFVIARAQQRRGLGFAAMERLIGHCRTGGASRMLLTVRAENLAAQGLYRKVGFAPTGDQAFGEDVWSLAL